jgi:Ca2+-binding RTX toxin-like protein
MQENLTLAGTAAFIDGTGNMLANRIVGTAGANSLNGWGGADTLVGGAGDDTYYVDSAGDVVLESSGGGVDWIVADVTRALGVEQENLLLAGTAAVDGSGNELANTILGNEAANVLEGGLGADTLAGGAGNDSFVIRAAAHSSASAWDSILDFAQGDRIDLSQLDGNVASAAVVEDFSFIGGAGFGADATAQLRYTFDSGTGTLMLYGSNDADGLAEIAIEIHGVTALSAADFIF